MMPISIERMSSALGRALRPLISEGGDGKRVSPSKEKRDHSVWLDNNLVTVNGGKLNDLSPHGA